MKRELADVLETVKRAKDRDKACTLLIGAGCSVKAGIPTAAQFVEIIRKKYPRAHDRAEKKSYPHVMAQLSMAERRDLISDYINKAKINWAHIAIAQLIKHGYVDRLLTVNFDPLVMRACALVGVFPAVYDFAASQSFKPDFIAQQSVFYLHGQHTSFVVLNTEAEVARLSEHLGPVFTDSIRGHVWIVVGYSGDNDPVFTHLTKIERFDNNLYWICHKANEPGQHVKQKLLVDGKDCYSIEGFDADDFFVALAQGLDCFPPDFVQTPFTHLDNLLKPVMPYSLPGKGSSLEAIPKRLLQDAIENIEKPAALALKASELLLSGDFAAVIEMERDYSRTPTPELADLIAWAHISIGVELTDKAKNKKGKVADRLYERAGKKFAAALRIKPEKDDALYNWGLTLDEQADVKTGAEAEQLRVLAGEKYAAALEINKEDHSGLINWGICLAKRAEEKTAKEADGLFTLAFKKFEASLKIKPEYVAAHYNWAIALSRQAHTKSGKQADHLWELSIRQIRELLKIRPDYHPALYSWAIELHAQAATKSGEKRNQLLRLAREKYEAAKLIAPDVYRDDGFPDGEPTALIQD